MPQVGLDLHLPPQLMLYVGLLQLGLEQHLWSACGTVCAGGGAAQWTAPADLQKATAAGAGSRNRHLQMGSRIGLLLQVGQRPSATLQLACSNKLEDGVVC